jgi:hypothetical protein
MSVQRAQHEITSTEFLDWMAFLDLESKKQTKQDYYLASIAAEVFRSNAKYPKKVKPEDFLLTYTDKIMKSVKSKSDKAKSFFGALLGSIKKDK